MRVAVITTSRADWNSMGVVAKALETRGAQVIVLAAYGHRALFQVEDDGLQFTIVGGSSGDFSLVGLDAAIMADTAGVISSRHADMAVVIGDRHEMAAATHAAVMAGVPVAHIAGGEVSGGSMDEYWRHAITKMSNLHFPATTEAAQRIVQMGEAREDVYVFGSPAVDRIRQTHLPTRAEALDAAKLGRSTGQYLLVNWQAEHPETGGLDAMLRSLRGQDLPMVIIGPNQDPGADDIHGAMLTNVGELTRAIYHKTLPAPVYLSLLKHAVALVGNSSSGFYEAPFFGTPVVNIGDRQKGRGPRPQCMKSVAASSNVISKAIAEVHRAGRWPEEYPFGKGGAGDRIAQTILSTEHRKSWSKRFHD